MFQFFVWSWGMSDDYEYHRNKRADRVYLSRSLETKAYRKLDDGSLEEFRRPLRIVSKVVDTKEAHEFFKDGKEVSLRITKGGRQEIKAKFYEDSRDVSTLQIQRYTIHTGMPHRTYFTFVGDEITTLYNFLRNIAVLPTRDKRSARLDDAFVENLVLTRDQAIRLLENTPELAGELVKHQVSARDVAELGHRRAQLNEFRQLLEDEEYFEEQRKTLGNNKRSEDVWQGFFEKNTWIFGYGLSYYFNTPIDGDGLEQVVKGYDFQSGGKRVDALLKTQGLVSALSFGEIKTHKTSLLKSNLRPYRRGSWQVSDELSGGIAQVQRAVQVSIENIRTRIDSKAADGTPTGETAYLYHPKSFLVIGSLTEFETDNGINEERYSSFELFRRNVVSPEILTFDELYERAKYIVESETRNADLQQEVGVGR